MAYQESEMEWEEFWEWIHNLEDGKVRLTRRTAKSILFFQSFYTA